MRAHGLTLDDTARTLHPLERKRILRLLCLWYGDGRDGQLEASLMSMPIDLEERLETSRWKTAYLGRYLRFQPSEVEAMGPRESWKYVRIAGELLSKEVGKPPGEDS